MNKLVFQTILENYKEKYNYTLTFEIYFSKILI